MNKKGIVFSADTERKIVHATLAAGPVLWYFHKHSKFLLSSKFAQKQSSYYNPMANKLGYQEGNRIHHYQELVVRSVLSYGLGFMVSRYFYGSPKPYVEPELA